MTLRTIVNTVVSDASDINQYKALYQGGQVYDVKNGYGAMGDGSTDDTTAIQTAINAAPGGIVFFPPGNYKLTAALVLPSSTHLFGSGNHYTATANRTRIFQTAQTPVVKNSDQTNGNSDIRLENLWLAGNGAGATVNAVDIRGSTGHFCHGIRIIESFVDTATGHGIYFLWVQESEIIRGWGLTSTGDAIQLETSTDNLIEGCQLATAAAGTGDGISFYNTADNNIIRSNFIFLAQRGIYLKTAHRNLIEGNRVNTCRREGILLAGASAGDVTYNTVIGNTCYDNGSALAGTRAGICLDTNTDLNLVEANTLSDTGGGTQVTGIRLAASVANNHVVGNHCGANGLTNTSSAKNVIRSNSGYNPVGSVTTPSFPATTVAQANTTSVDVDAYITAGTGAVTVQVDAVAALMVIPANGVGTVRIPAGSTFTPTYSAGSPTWKWYGN